MKSGEFLDLTQRISVCEEGVRIILKWTLKKWSVRIGTGFTWLRIGSSGGLL
jgi:activator of HSP90 ATPase